MDKKEKKIEIPKTTHTKDENTLALPPFPIPLLGFDHEKQVVVLNSVLRGGNHITLSTRENLPRTYRLLSTSCSSMTSQYIMALDQGTTSCRAILYDKTGSIVSVGQKEFKQIFPHAGWVEHDANEIWSTQLEVAKTALVNSGFSSANVAAIGITNQRETTVIWDKATGEPVHNAIVWQDKRTAAYCRELSAKGVDKIVKAKTGLVLDSYFSATKIKVSE